MKSIILLENTKPEKSTLKAHHGLSLFIEWKGKNILFDTGQNSDFARNARQLGVDLEDIDYCIISHGHYDHGGGLREFFRRNKKAPVYLKPSSREKYFSRKADGRYKNIGLDLKLFKNFRDRFLFVEDRAAPSPGILLLSPADFKISRPRGNSSLFMHRQGEYREDRFDHEIMMVIHDEDSLALFTGCAHNGILNMVQTVQQEFPGKKITSLIGGFHLMLAGDSRPGETEDTIRMVGEKLAELDIPKTYTGHCTAKDAYSILESILGDRIMKMTTGLQIQ